MFLLINPLIPNSAICQDEIPASGKETNKVYVWKINDKTNYSLLFLPTDKDGRLIIDSILTLTGY